MPTTDSANIKNNADATPRPFFSAQDDSTWITAIVESAVDGIIAIDEQGFIQYMNPSAQQMFGYKLEELINKKINSLMPEPHHRDHDKYLERYQHTGVPHIIGTVRELEGKRKDGTLFPFELSVSKAQLGNRLIFTGILHDISDRKYAQEEKDRILQDLNKRNLEVTCLYRVGESIRSRQLLSDIFEDVVKLLHTAFSRPEVMQARVIFDGESCCAGTFEPTPWRLSSKIVVGGRPRGSVEMYSREKPLDGMAAFSQEEHDLVQAVASALGEAIERRDAETKVIQASKLASIGELAAGVGHEINNPVNGIINCADILMESLTASSKEHQFASLIRSEAERIAKIVHNLLTFSRQDREHHSPARLCDIVEVVLSLSRKKLDKCNVFLDVDVPESLPKIRCSSEQLQQVVMNLLINSLHSLEDKFPEANAEKRIIIKARQVQTSKGDILRLTVEDRGLGINPAIVDRLFDPFFTTKGRDRGTGLGLSVSDGIIKEHGGQIWVESDEGRYARFQIDLPLENGREAVQVSLDA